MHLHVACVRQYGNDFPGACDFKEARLLLQYDIAVIVFLIWEITLDFLISPKALPYRMRTI